MTRLSLYSHQHVSCAVTNVHAQTHTQKPSHNNTPFLCTAVLVSGNTGERRYLSPCGCGQSAEAACLCIHVTLARALGVFFTAIEHCWERHLLLKKPRQQCSAKIHLITQTLPRVSGVLTFSVFVWALSLTFLLMSPFFHLQNLHFCIPVYFKISPWCCRSPIQEALADIGHQEDYVRCLRYECCLQSIVKLKEKTETLAQLWGDICLWLFYLAAITSSCCSIWAGIHLFM